MNTTSLYRSPAGEREVMALYDRVLDHWPVPHEERYVDTRQGCTFAIVSGPKGAPALVLLHGTCSNATSWVGDVVAYSQVFRTYAVDLPGEPGRSAPNRPPWSGPGYVEWLSDLLDGLGVAESRLVGLSQGGWTALKFATACPERVTRLALLAPGGIAPARASFILRAIPLSLLGRPGAEAINRITFGREPIHPEAVAYMNAIMTNFRPRIGAVPMFTDAELQRLTMPVLLVAGEQDALLPSAKTAARLQALLPHITIRLLPGTGHVLANMAPEIVPFLAA
jgi:pimeloyl-ACP methyl ester carboxylesterase